jgi:hypothetical protein
VSNYPTIAELTAAHPEWRKADTMNSDLLTVPMICVYTQRSAATVLAAMRTGRLRARHNGRGGSWRALLSDVQRWAMCLPVATLPNRRPA